MDGGSLNVAAPTEIALFAGAGGGVLASRILGHRIVCYVEREPFPVAVLKARIADGLIDDAPIWDDVRTFDGRPWRGLVDIVSGGFPCQPFSAAGKQLGPDDERNCWPDVLRILREVRPRIAFLENVAALVATDYFDRIVGDLAESGYVGRYDCIPASAVGAPHRRDRVWILARLADAGCGDARGGGEPSERHEEAGAAQGDVPERKRRGDTARAGGGDVDDAHHARLEGRGGIGMRERAGEWAPGPAGPLGEVVEPSSERWREGRAEYARIEGRQAAAVAGGAMGDASRLGRERGAGVGDETGGGRA